MSTKGYKYSKIIFYILSEENTLDANSLRNNKKLEKIIEMRMKYKSKLIILLTHSDTYCDKIKKENDWKNLCKKSLNDNKNYLLDHANQLVKEKYKSDFKMNENDVFHISLDDYIEISDDEIINNFDDDNLVLFNQGDKALQSMLLKFAKGNYKKNQTESKDFTIKELNVLDKNKLIEKLKEILPSQYHSVFNSN